MIWRPGEQIGPYTIVSQLGQGGMATVYKAHHPQLDRTVAIKVMHSNYLDDNNFLERFKREAQIVASLEHPHIVPIYDFNEQDGMPYLVMKFIQGRTLKEQLFKKTPSLEDILHIMGAIADAATYAHKKGVLHRDIKPSNIVIDSDNIPYLADFGLARIVQAGESTMSADVLLGTPNYMSPEQAKGSKTIDHRSDIYSLGIVLYELVVGRVPFSADTPLAVIHDHIYKPLPLPSQVNPEIHSGIEAVLVKALAKNPKDRYQTANDMMDDFRRVINNEHITALDEDRASIADDSLARIRQEYVDEFDHANDNVARSIRNLGAPLADIKKTDGSQNPGLASATLYQKETHGKLWMMGGMGILILFLFLITAVVVNASNTFMQLVEVGQKLDRNGNLVDANENPSDANNFLDSVPVRNLLEAQQAVKDNPENSLNYLALARAQYASNQTNLAYQAIQTGQSYADNPVNYLASAAAISANANDHRATLVYALVAYDTATRTDAKLARDTIGKYLYEQAQVASTFDINRETEKLDEIIGADQAQQLVNAPITRIMISANQVAMKRSRLARLSFNTWTDEARNLPEGQLVTAEYDLLVGEKQRAKQGLEDLANDSDTPEWIVTIADDLLNTLED